MPDLPRPKQLATAVKKAAEEEGVTERRFRRWVAVSALIEVFNIARAQTRLPEFLVKGGFALECRYRSLARSSRDVDIVLGVGKQELIDAAVEAMRMDWSGFTFRIKGEPEEREHSYKFEVNSVYLESDWSTFEVELVAGEVVEPEMLKPHPVDALGLTRPSDVPCMNVYEQIAQKIHAVTDPSEERPRDLLDIFLLERQLELDDSALRGASEKTFRERATHEWPPTIELRDGWSATIEELLRRNKLPFSVDQILDAVRALMVRMLGVSLKMNYRYHFVVLSAKGRVPNVNESALMDDEGYAALQRMTEQEGWRLVQVIDYPSSERTHAMLAILEKPIPSTEEN